MWMRNPSPGAMCRRLATNAIRAGGVAAFLVAAGAPATAQVAAAPPPDSRATLNLSIENDIFGGSDRYYTSGLQLAWRSASTDVTSGLGWLYGGIDSLLGPGSWRIGLAVGHQIYTPQDTDRRDPDPRDRPYAGHLYVSGSLLRVTEASLTAVELQLGVVGPSALGEEVQNNFHTLIGTSTSEGWDTQLRDESVVNLIGQRHWRMPGPRLLGLETEALPTASFSLGNANTHLAGGVTLRIGRDLAADFGAPRIRPGLTGSSFFQPRSSFGWYLFAGPDGRAVVRDIFLDGNTLQDSRSVDSRPLVFDARAGIAIHFGEARLSYTHVWRSEEFYGQANTQQFGSLNLSVRF
jgi:lipid A 3-O-deacylase